MSDFAATHRQEQRAFVEYNASLMRRSRRTSRFFHREVDRLVAVQIQMDARVIDIGCGAGSLFSQCEVAAAVGIEIDADAVAIAAQSLPDVTFLNQSVEECGALPLVDPDAIVLSMVLDEVYDAQAVLAQVRGWCTPQTRLITVTYSRLWRPLLRLAELLRLKARRPDESYLPRQEVENMLELTGFEITKRQDGVLIPVWIPLLSRFVNRWIAPLPLIRALCLVRVTVARPLVRGPRPIASVSVVIAARNEAGHIRELVERIPALAARQEVIFVEGGSSDDTWERIQEVIAAPPATADQTITALKQTGIGKGDAVRTGFAAASGDVLLILDADISVPPEELPRFIEALAADTCEFANGSRLVYPMEARAMRFLNLLGNKFFGTVFSYLLGQPVRDTLCGTKVLWRMDYERIARYRARFGEIDPFGDFDLLFGASGLSLRIRDIPIHYKERTYGETNISRFRHGWLLIRMAALAATKLKFVG